MAKITNLTDFHSITSNITCFSHAYLFDVNSLDKAFFYVKDFAKKIICSNMNDSLTQDIIYKIDHDEFDDLYVVNPSTIGISTNEITKLLYYMETKSLRENGKRVYIIYGFERLSRDVSNKILKFLEEPDDNIYALLMTENIDKILPTIISRCQVIRLSFENEQSSQYLDLMQSFLENIIDKKNSSIAYINDYFKDLISNRDLFFEAFSDLERVISDTINYKYKISFDKTYVNESLSPFDADTLINILDITNYLKSLVKQNINLNLLLDRYIIEIVKELDSCKK